MAYIFDHFLFLFLRECFVILGEPGFSLAIVAVLLITTFVFRAYIIARIGGYTGDCLGALQQIAEAEFCLGFLAFQALH